MSIFAKIKGAKKAAKDHKQAQHGAAPETVDKPVPYKHVPTHAAIDAMAGAPASYREADRAEIKATNEKRRSMLAQSSSGVSSPLHRNSSYGSTSNYSYSRPMPPRLEARRSYGANGGYYTNGLQVGHQPFSPSPLASKGPSPTGSLNESSSSSSSHLVEMQYTAPVSHTVPFQQTAPVPVPAPTSYGMATAYTSSAPKRFEQTMETIHSSPKRKLGEAPLLSQPPATVAKPAVTPTPVQAKKRSWGFGKRNSHGPAIAAH